MESNKSSAENTATMATNQSSDKKVTLAILRYIAALGPIPGRPDLPPFTFRLFEVVIRKHHRCFWVEFKPNEPKSSIDVHLSYHPNIANIRRALGGLTQLIHVEKLDLSISSEEDSMAATLFFALNPVSSSLPTTASASVPTSSWVNPLPAPAISAAPTLESLLSMPSTSGIPSSLSSGSTIASLSQKRKKKSALDKTKKKSKKVEFNDDLDKFITLEEIVQHVMDGE